MGNRPLDPILWGKIIGGSGGSGSVTPASIVTATGQMTPEQAAQTRGNIGAEPEKFVVTVTDDGQGGYTADKSVAEILTAYRAGKTAIAQNTGSTGLVTAYLHFAYDGVVLFATMLVVNDPETEEYEHTQIVGYIENDTDVWEVISGIFVPKPKLFIIADSIANITPEPNTIYSCNALSSLTIIDNGVHNFVIKFKSGATPTTTTIPASIKFQTPFVAEANTRYEINVDGGYAVVGSWAVTT